MTDPKKEGREPASIFWEERACQFDDLSPAIAAICRDKANSAWLAAECDRLTAALQQSSVDKTDAERYRWLRGRVFWTTYDVKQEIIGLGMKWDTPKWPFNHRALSNDNLDAAIDTALAKKE